MRKYCEEAVTYGDVGESVTAKQKQVLVILNPVADKKSAAESVGLSSTRRYKCYFYHPIVLNIPNFRSVCE